MTPPHHDRPANMTRLLHAARGLVVDHGPRKVTIAEIARVAGVGKGTVYLYWDTKEDLVLSLLADEATTSLHHLADDVRQDPQLVRPSTLAATVLTANARNEIFHALAADPLFARMVAEGRVAETLDQAASPLAMCRNLVPVLRAHGLVRDDVPVEVLAYGLHGLVAGEVAHLQTPALADGVTDDERRHLFRAAVAALLGEHDDPAALAAASVEVAGLFVTWADTVDEYLVPRRNA